MHKLHSLHTSLDQSNLVEYHFNLGCMNYTFINVAVLLNFDICAIVV